jgi:heterodisulfide reductase subunit D
MLNFDDIVRRTKVRYCLDCGKCTAVCPVSKFNPQFSPRLIVQSALRGNGNGAIDPDVWNCLGCNLCSTRCSYNVNYVEFIRYLRMKSRENGTRIIYSHSGIPDSIMHIMGKHDVEQNRLGWLPGDIRTDTSADTAFFVGCSPYFDTIFRDINVKTTDSSIGAMRLLNAAGVPFRLLANERCCGHDLLLSGDAKGFMDLALANLEELKKQGITKLITSCPECYYTLKIDYSKFVDKWDMEIQHLLEIPAIFEVVNKSTAKGSGPRRLTYQDSCRLGRFLKLYEEPRSLLGSIKGVELVEMTSSRENSICCGSSPWMFCGAVNRRIQDERLLQAADTGADCLVTSCPKCQIHLTCAQVAQGANSNKIVIRDLYNLVSDSLEPEENN